MNALAADFLAAIYEGVDGADHWHRVADAAARWIDPEAVCHFMIGEAGSAPTFHILSRNRSNALLETYRETYLDLDSRVPLAMARPGEFVSGVEAMGDEAFERTELVNDFLDRPDVDVRWSVG